MLPQHIQMYSETLVENHYLKVCNMYLIIFPQYGNIKMYNL